MLGEWLPMVPEQTILERIQSGHTFLVKITGQDFGFEPLQWHEYLQKTDAGGGIVRENKHLGIGKDIKKAVKNPEWRAAVKQLIEAREKRT